MYVFGSVVKDQMAVVVWVSVWVLFCSDVLHVYFCASTSNEFYTGSGKDEGPVHTDC
jgi:hypothetical protein